MNKQPLQINELRKIICNNDTAKINSMKDVDFNYQDDEGRTVLMEVIEGNKIVLSRKLINSGVNLDLQDNNGVSAILESVRVSHYAICNGKRTGDMSSITNLLIEKGACLDLQDKWGRTLLIYEACVKHEVGSEMKDVLAKKLINCGANLNIQDNQGNTSLFEAIFYKNTSLTKLLINSGADLNIKDANNQTALLKLILHNDKENAKIIINKPGIDLNYKDSKGNTALINSICIETNDDDKSRELTILLLNKGVDINSKNNDGFSALMFACRDNKQETCKMLIERGADYDLVNNDGVSARDIVMSNELIKYNKLLNAKEFEDYNLYFTEDMERLTTRGWPQKLKYTETVVGGETKFLIDVDVLFLDSVEGRPVQIAEYWINKGVNIDQKNISLETPLITSCKRTMFKDYELENNINIAKQLIHSGANLDYQDSDGKTALMIALHYNTDEIAELLINKGANLNIKDNDGLSALMQCNSWELNKLMLINSTLLNSQSISVVLTC